MSSGTESLDVAGEPEETVAVRDGRGARGVVEGGLCSGSGDMEIEKDFMTQGEGSRPGFGDRKLDRNDDLTFVPPVLSGLIAHT